MVYHIERLGPHHDRSAFSCGAPALDRYLRDLAGQQQRSLATVVYVLVPDDHPALVIGYYTLSSCEIATVELPPEFAKRLPRYPVLPATLIGRLALDQRYQGQRLGGDLLGDALRRARDHAHHIAAMAVVVDAKDDAARAFYEHYGFQRLTSHADRLFLPMKTIQL